MEMRNGVWTSQTRADDARDIERWARQIRDQTDEPDVEALARKIIRAARDLQD